MEQNVNLVPFLVIVALMVAWGIFGEPRIDDEAFRHAPRERKNLDRGCTPGPGKCINPNCVRR